MAGEDRHHARLAVRVLARPVHVTQATDHVGDALGLRPGLYVRLRRQLGRAIGRQGFGEVVLGRRPRRLVSVQRAACRREHDRRTAARGSLEHVQRALDVDVAVANRVLHRGHHAGLRCQVEDRLRRDLCDDRVQGGPVDDVQLAQVRLGGHATRVAGGQIVDDRHVAALRQQRVYHVRADEAGAAGHDRAGSHARKSIRLRATRRWRWTAALRSPRPTRRCAPAHACRDDCAAGCRPPLRRPA